MNILRNTLQTLAGLERYHAWDAAEKHLATLRITEDGTGQKTVLHNVVIARRIYSDGAIPRIEFPDGLRSHDPKMVESVYLHMVYHIAIESRLQGIVCIN